MPRARNIKYSFFENDELADLEPLARLLFIGMWTIADYKGDFEWRERKIKKQLLPYDDCNISELAINLDKSGFVRFFSDGNKIYCRVVNFAKHQHLHKNEREKGSDIPEYSQKMRQAIDFKGLLINPDKSGLNQDYSQSDPAVILNPKSLIPKSDLVDDGVLDEDNANAEKFTPEDLTLAESMFESIKSVVPKSKPPNFKSWANDIRLMRERDNHTFAEITRVFEWANKDPFWQQNILSPGKLRKQFASLHAKSCQAKPKMSYEQSIGITGVMT
jgi:hypothetical protein